MRASMWLFCPFVCPSPYHPVQPDLSQIPHVCAAEPGRWPNHAHSCRCSKPGSSPQSILWSHLRPYKRKQEPLMPTQVFQSNLYGFSCSHKNLGYIFYSRLWKRCQNYYAPRPGSLFFTCGIFALHGHYPAFGSSPLPAAEGTATAHSVPRGRETVQVTFWNKDQRIKETALKFWFLSLTLMELKVATDCTAVLTVCKTYTGGYRTGQEPHAGMWWRSFTRSHY